MCIGHVTCLKRLITAAFRSSEWFHNVKTCIIGVLVPFLHGESTESVYITALEILSDVSYMYKHLYTPFC